MSDYTPTTEEVRRSWERPYWEPSRSVEFDRWLAEVKAEAWEEGYTYGNSDAFTEARLDRDNPYLRGEEQ